MEKNRHEWKKRQTGPCGFFQMSELRSQNNPLGLSEVRRQIVRDKTERIRCLTEQKLTSQGPFEAVSDFFWSPLPRLSPIHAIISLSPKEARQWMDSKMDFMKK